MPPRRAAASPVEPARPRPRALARGGALAQSGGVRQECVLSLDVGTSSVRASLYDARGDAVPGAVARILHEVRYLPDGGVETSADALLEAVGAAVDHCLQAADRPVAAVGISCFWHSLLGTDGALRPVTPLLMWPDTRSAAEVASLAARLDGEAVRRRTGCRLHPSYPPAKLCWVARARPQWWAAARFWLSFGDYLTHWLTGELVSSVSTASASGLYDQRAGAWDREVLAAVGLDEWRLPPVADLDEVALRCRHAARWRALAGVPVLLPAGDGACNNLGSGCVGEDRVALMIGTSGASRVLRAGGPWEVPASLWQYRLDRRRGLVGGALSNGGNLHRWLVDALRLPEGDPDALVADMEPDAHGLTFVPLLAGERSPGWAPGAFGGVVGLRESTTPLQLLRAGMEAVALRFAALVRDLDATVGRRGRLIGSGGGLWHSPAWSQILADAVGREVERSAEPEASSRGAALLALERIGAVADAGALPAPVSGVVHADPRRHARYVAAWRRQQRLYQFLASDPVVGFPSAAGPGARPEAELGVAPEGSSVSCGDGTPAGGVAAGHGPRGGGTA